MSKPPCNEIELKVEFDEVDEFDILFDELEMECPIGFGEDSGGVVYWKDILDKPMFFPADVYVDEEEEALIFRGP